MRSRASSSRAESAARARTGAASAPRWYREPWPWLLMAGPLAVVAASIVTVWLAIRSDDGVVAQDYYRLGLLINQRLERAPAETPQPRRATIRFAADGRAEVHVEGLASPPERLRLTIGHPGTSAADEIVTLTRRPDGDYEGTLAHRGAGRRVVTLESARWRLPTTMVSGDVAEIRSVSEPG